MNHFMQYQEHSILSKSHGKKIILARSTSGNLNYPQLFVVKSTTSQSEIETHKRLNELDPTTLKLYHSWDDRYCYKMSLEYCEKGDLHSVLSQGVKYSFKVILKKCCEIAKVVYLMHSNGLVHRDIKPLNIFINKNYEYKLADFGESKKFQSNKPHTVKGTLNYFSPELRRKLASGNTIESNPFRDDIWALGVTFFELSIGHICHELFHVSYNNLADFILDNFKNTKCPTWFCNLILQMLSVNPENFIHIQDVFAILQSNLIEQANHGLNKICSLSMDSDRAWTDIRTISICKFVPTIASSGFSDESSEELTLETIEEKQPQLVLQITEIKCMLCKESLTDEKIQLECGEIFHAKCIKELLNEILRSAKNSKELKCPYCFKKVSAKSLACINNIFDDYLKINCFMFSEMKAFCQKCDIENEVFMLCQNLTPKDYRCVNCNNKYCSFCTVIGGHRWSCDNFEKYKAIR